MNLKLLKRALLLLASVFALAGSARPMKYLSKISPFSKSSDQRDALTQKMDKFATAQQELKFARERAEARGQTSSRTVGKALENLDKTSRELRSAVTKAQTRGELSERHVEDLASIRSKIEAKEIRRIDEGRSKPLTNEERRTFETLTEVTKPLRASPSAETVPQAIPTGFFPTSKGDASVMLSEKGNDPAYKKPIKSFQDRIEAMKDNEYVQKAQREFDDAKQKSIALEAQFRAAQPSDKNFKELKDEFLKVNKSMMQKQNVLLIELEAAEKSSKPTIEKPVETPRAWTKVIQTDTDKVPSGIKIGQKTADTPPALPSRNSVFKKETSSSFTTDPEKTSVLIPAKPTGSQEQIISPKELAQSLSAAKKEQTKLQKEVKKSGDELDRVQQQYSKLSNSLKKNMSAEDKDSAQIYDNAHQDVARKQARIQELTRQISLDPGNQANIAQKENALTELQKSRENLKIASENAPESYVKKMENIANKRSQTIVANAVASGRWGDAARTAFDLEKELTASKLKAQAITQQPSEEKPSTSVQRVGTSQEALEKVGARRPQQTDDEKNLSSGLTEFLKGKPGTQEQRSAGPIPVTKDSPGGRTGVALPPQSASEKEFSELPKQEKIRIMQETFTVEK